MASRETLVALLMAAARPRGSPREARPGCLDEEAVGLVAQGRKPRPGWPSHLASCSRCARLVGEVLHALIRRPRSWWERVGDGTIKVGGAGRVLLRGRKVVRGARHIRRAARAYVDNRGRQSGQWDQLLLAAGSPAAPKGRIQVRVVDARGAEARGCEALVKAGPRFDRGVFQMSVVLAGRGCAAGAAVVSVRLGGDERLAISGRVRGGALTIEAGGFGGASGGIALEDIEIAVFAGGSSR